MDHGTHFGQRRGFGVAKLRVDPGQQGIAAAVRRRLFGGSFQQVAGPGEVTPVEGDPCQSDAGETRPVVGFEGGEERRRGSFVTSQLYEQVALRYEYRGVARCKCARLVEIANGGRLVDDRGGVCGEMGPLIVVRFEPHCLCVADECRLNQFVGVVDPAEPPPGGGRASVLFEVACHGVDQRPDRFLHATRVDGRNGRIRRIGRASGQDDHRHAGECAIAGPVA